MDDTVNVLNATELLKDGYGGNFYIMYVLPQLKESEFLNSLEKREDRSYRFYLFLKPASYPCSIFVNLLLFSYDFCQACPVFLASKVTPRPWRAVALLGASHQGSSRAENTCLFLRLHQFVWF